MSVDVEQLVENVYVDPFAKDYVVDVRQVGTG